MNKKMLSLLALLVLVLFSMSLLAGCGSSKKEARKSTRRRNSCSSWAIPLRRTIITRSVR